MSSRNYLIMSSDMSLMDKREYRINALAAGLERCGLKNIGSINSDIPQNWNGKNAPGLQSIPEAEKEARIALIRSFIGTGVWPKSIDQRELAPLTDFVLAAAQDSWLTVALAAVGTVYSALNALPAYQLPAGRLMVCYGVTVESVSPIMPVSRLLFRRAGAGGNIQAQFDMEPMGVRWEQCAFFSEPVVLDPQETYAIQVMCRVATAIGERIHIDNFLFESSGGTIA